jgi:3-phenylpropionate/cinnamic acid dioxygenase small subunit
MSSDVNLICRIGQFYYREARLLDERCYQQWFTLVDESIEYTMPLRYVPMPDPQKQDTEDFLAVNRELDGAKTGKGSPMRRDHYMELLIRTVRPYKRNSWSESPPPRTRRCISNIEVEPIAEREYRVYSNFQLFYSHNGADNCTYTGCRRDILKETEDDFRLFQREVITDWNIITAPTMALIF